MLQNKLSGLMLEGLVKYSIPITLVTFVLGLIIALFTALMRISTSKILRSIARVYVSIIRGTPDDSTIIYHLLWYSRIR